MLNILQFTSLKRFSQLSHGITTRHFKPDISTSQGQSYFLKINRADQSTLILPKQIHSSEILIIERKDLSLKKEQLVGDAVITNQLNIWIGILVADCFPILIFDPINRVVAVVHAGWRGIEQNIHLKTIYYLCKFVKCSLKNLFIGIGPGIGSCCFEVEKEVSEKFKKRSSATIQFIHNVSNQKDTIDLRGILNVELIAAGIPLDNIENMNYCTACRSDLFYSYRKEGKNTGRMLLAAGLKVDPFLEKILM